MEDGMTLRFIISMSIVIAIFIWAIRRSSMRLEENRRQLNNPQKYSEYLTKLAHITETSEFDVFVKAGKEHKIPMYMIKSDFSKYLKTGCPEDKIPSYVKELIDEGKEIIRDAEVSPFTNFRF